MVYVHWLPRLIRRTVSPRQIWFRESASNVYYLAAALKKLDDEYDYIFIDSQGARGILQQSIILASDTLLSPIIPDVLESREFMRGTVLGNLHGNLSTGANLLGITIVGDAYPEIRDKSERDIRLVLQMYPQFAGRINIELLPTGPWGASQ